ncbi:MAG TPA: class I SAM-dependent methyltransferase [Roseiflexaceae bacterium]|nr:class I SAM-dependent methyltransferase [Roseiflexaceae bacterium]
MAIYHEYAPFYDGSGQIRFAVLMGQYLREVLARHPVGGRQALDLACGTGTLAITLADDGWNVVGLDSSEPMLAIARDRARTADAPERLSFVQGDMRELRIKHAEWRNSPSASTQVSILDSQFDLVTCTYDSLNYLTDERDLANCFAGAADALKPGGLFFGDMNTHYFLEHDWPTCEVLEQPGFVQIAQSYFDPATACSTMVLTGFAGDDTQGYARFDETHVERAYPPEQVAALLAAAGLRVEAAYDCFTFQPVYELSQRIAWVARKPDIMTS